MFMVGSLGLFRKKEKGVSLFLDIGSEAVKSLILQEKEGKIDILGCSLEYVEKCATSEIKDFEKGILKRNILKTIEEARRGVQIKPERVYFTLPAETLKGRVVSLSFKRKVPQKTISPKKQSAGRVFLIGEREEREIYQKVLSEAKKKIAETYSQNSGILAQDIGFTNLKILGVKIDGYEVPGLRGYDGENLGFEILTTFLPEYYLKEIKSIILAAGFERQEIIHEIEGLTPYLKGDSEGIFLDVGGEVTQIFLIRAGKLTAINEFELGGRNFSQTLSERLGLGETEARLFKERYSKNELSKETTDRVKEILCSVSQAWLRNLKTKLEKINKGGLLPQNIKLFGGGSQLPEIKEILEGGDWSGLPFAGQPQVETITLKEFTERISSVPNFNFGMGSAFLSGPQGIPLILICYAKTKKDY